MSHLVESDRLILRRWKPGDLEPFAELNSDPRVMEFFPSTLSRVETEAMIKTVEERIDQHGFGQPVDWREEKGKFILEARRFDPTTNYNEVRLFVVDKKAGRAKTYHHRLRLYSKPEIVAMMKRAGLKDIRVFGDFKGGAYRRLESSHPIYIGRKP